MVLPARPILQPVQTQYPVAGVPQPSHNFVRLKRPISWAEVAIEQLCDFSSRARSLDLVQRAQDMLVDTVVRIWRLRHLRFSGLKLDLLRAVHFCVRSVANKKPQVTNRWVRTGEPICKSPLHCALRRHPPKYTSVQSRLVPRLASPNSHLRATRR